MKDDYKDSVLGKIPVSWDMVKLEDITSKISDGIHTTPKYVEKSDCFFINGNNLNNGRIQLVESSKCVDENEFLKHKRDLDLNTVLISINGTIGNIAFYNGEKVILGKSAAYIKCSNLTTKKFIFYQLQSERVNRYFAKELTGTTIKNLSLKTLKNTPLSFPPLPEQQKIADILTTVDDKLENIESQIAEYTNLKTGLMQQLLTKGVGHTKFVESELGMIPEGWEVVKLDDCAEIIMGQSPESKFYNDKGNGNYLIQGNADIKNRQTRPRIWTSNLTKECKIGDIIMTVRAPVGAIAKSIHNACIGRGVCSIKPKEINAEFLYQFLILYESKWTALEQGSTFTAVNGKDIRGIAIPKPPPLEQQRISAILSSVDEKLESLQSKKDESTKLKKGLMEQLLTGRIRVKV